MIEIIKHRNKIIILSTIIILIEIGLILTTFYILNNNTNNDLITLMEILSENICDNMQSIINLIESVLIRNVIFFQIHGKYLSLSNYNDIIQYNKVSLGLNIDSYITIMKISDMEKYSYQNFCSNYIIKNCMIKDIQNLTFYESTNKLYYYPLIYQMPLLPNYESLIGFDLNSTNITSNIINSINININFSASGRINILNSDYDQNNYAILLSTPIYINKNIIDLDNIYGFCCAIIRIYYIYYNSLLLLNTSLSIDDLDFFAFDTIDNNILYKESNLNYNDIMYSYQIQTNFNTYKFDFEFANRNLTLFFKYSDNFINNNKHDLALIISLVLASLLILCDLIIIIIYISFNIFKRKSLVERENILANLMLSYVNHEIRNPLNVIKGLIVYTLETFKSIDKVEILEDTNIEIDQIILETIISDLSTVVGSCNMLEHIITDILDIKKLEAGQINVNNEIININEFMIDLYKTISQKADEKQNVKLEFIYEKDMTYYFDSLRMKQILLNFLTNSLKYTESGSIKVIISKEIDTIIFSVIDTGRGIKDELKNNIFNPFTQLSSQDSVRFGGIGLGLYLCKMLTERMNGKIGFESEYGKGTTFWIKFPLESFLPS